MANFESFWICNEGEKAIFVRGSKHLAHSIWNINMFLAVRTNQGLSLFIQYSRSLLATVLVE
jgi:hypothetical protein